MMPTVAPPPPEKPRRPPPAVGAASRVAPTRAHPKPGYERALAWSLLLSLLVHAAVFLLPGRFIDVEVSSPPSASRQPADAAASGLDWVVPVPEGAEGGGEAAGAGTPSGATQGGAERAPEVPRVVRVLPADVEETGGGAAGAGQPAGGNARDALRPGFRDPRLYVEPNPLGPAEPAQSNHQRYMEHLQARIDAINDSIYASDERARRATDWTVTDGDGGRWGISPEGIHLGGFTIPKEVIPMGRTGDNATREAGMEEERRREEIQRQERTGETERVREERIRAMRERADSLRASGGS